MSLGIFGDQRPKDGLIMMVTRHVSASGSNDQLLPNHVHDNLESEQRDFINPRWDKSGMARTKRAMRCFIRT